MRIRIALPVVIGLAALVGCAPTAPQSAGPSAEPSQGATPTPSTTPTPSPEPGDEASIVLTASGFSIVDGDRTGFEHEWSDEAAPAVAALTDVFGVQPEKTSRAGDGTHYADFAVYVWSGFEFADALNLDKPRDEYFLPSTVSVTAVAPHGVEVRTAGGAAVSSTFESIAHLEPYPREGSESPQYLIEALDPALLGDPDNGTDAIELVMSPDGMSVVSIHAPRPSLFAA